jgi:SnoaL-like domain
MTGRRRLPTVIGMTELGETFVAAVAARDFPALRATLADDVRFRLLVPRGPQANAGADETLGRFVGWFGAADELRLESAHVGTVAQRLVMTYRLRLRDAAGWRVIEQHLVADTGTDGRLATIDLLCTGFHAAG